MQYLNIFISLIIHINILLTLVLINIILISSFLKPYKNIKEYYIKNPLYSLIITTFHIGFFIAFLYCLRIYNLKQHLDLKKVFYKMKYFSSFLIHDYSVLTILQYISMLLLLTCILFIVLLTYKHLKNHLFNLYFFIRFNPSDKKLFEKISQPFALLMQMADSDLISFSIYKMSNYLNKRLGYFKKNLRWEKNPDIFSQEYERKSDIYIAYCRNRPWYHFDKIITFIHFNKFYKRFLIPTSPILFIFYDLFFNNCVITHVYYYLAFFIPLMLWRRFTILISTENISIGQLIWDILYEKETCLYALPHPYYNLFTVYIANGIKTIYLDPPALLDSDVSWFMSQETKFIYDKQSHSYQNKTNKSLKYISNNVLIYKDFDYHTQKQIKEEWFIIARKYYYINDKSYEIIIHLNNFI